MSFVLALVFLNPMTAGEIRGVIPVKRKPAKRAAAPSLDIYERGASVPIAVEEEDPVVYQRTQRVVYLEGKLTATVLRLLPGRNHFGPHGRRG